MAARRKSRFSFARLTEPLVGRLLGLLVREKVLGEKGFDKNTPVVYVLETDALSNVLILQQACRANGLPLPLEEIPVRGLLNTRRLVALQELHGLWVRRPDLRSHLHQLSRMLSAVEDERVADLQLVPVSVLLGRAPDRESSVFQILFSENWPIAGRIRKLISLILHGRSTLVQFSKPISLREALAEGLPQQRTARKLSRLLRVHFRRVRTAAIGPDLSHRRTVVDELVRSRPVREAIKQHAKRNNLPIAKVRRRAYAYAEEIAADYSYPVIRTLSRALSHVWNRIYNGIKVHHFDNLTDVLKGTEVIYVPCHRSHMDYLLVSYLLHEHGIVVPHIAAGVNLNLPVIGPILRRGGAFFLRRSFRSNGLYSAIFTQYVESIFSRGVSMEYFIEGGRSRTGRLLQPRTGMLAMTVRSYLKHPERPTVFVPVYLGYERLVEAGSYLGELSGGQKKKETLSGLLRSLRIVRDYFGRVHVSFGEGIDLAEHLDTCAPAEWREHGLSDDERPRWLSECVDHLGVEIMTRINAAADVNPINLVALALLSSSKNAVAEEDLLAHIDLYRHLIEAVPYSPLTTMTDLPAEEIIRLAEGMGMVKRRAHPLGDVIHCDERGAFLLSYFRNNVLHLSTVYSWCACMFVNNVSFEREELHRLGRAIYPFLKSELFLRYEQEEFIAACDACLEEFERLKLITAGTDGVLQRAHGASAEALQLKMLGQTVLASLERYYMTIALLVRSGSGTLTAEQLENLCHQTAQRLSMIYTLDTPDYFDKTLFKHFIRQLKLRGVVDTDTERKLTFGAMLPIIIEDAKSVLSKEIRHSILQAAPSPDKPARRAAA